MCKMELIILASEIYYKFNVLQTIGYDLLIEKLIL